MCCEKEGLLPIDQRLFWFVVHESNMAFEYMGVKYLDLANYFERVIILETVLTQCQISNSFYTPFPKNLEYNEYLICTKMWIYFILLF